MSDNHNDDSRTGERSDTERVDPVEADQVEETPFLERSSTSSGRGSYTTASGNKVRKSKRSHKPSAKAKDAAAAAAAGASSSPAATGGPSQTAGLSGSTATNAVFSAALRSAGAQSKFVTPETVAARIRSNSTFQCKC